MGLRSRNDSSDFNIYFYLKSIETQLLNLNEGQNGYNLIIERFLNEIKYTYQNLTDRRSFGSINNNNYSLNDQNIILKSHKAKDKFEL